MANCCICGKKLGMLSGVSLSFQYDGAIICNECNEYHLRLKKLARTKQIDADELHEVREYFQTWSASGKTTQQAQECLEEEWKEVNENEQKYLDFQERKDFFMTTTGYQFEGYQIIEYLNVMSGEVVLGTGFFSEINAQISDFLGTNSELFEGKIAKAKEAAMDNLINKALHAGANALIGIDFDLMTLTQNIIVVSVNGTAVRIKEKA